MQLPPSPLQLQSNSIEVSRQKADVGSILYSQEISLAIFSNEAAVLR